MVKAARRPARSCPSTASTGDRPVPARRSRRRGRRLVLTASGGPFRGRTPASSPTSRPSRRWPTRPGMGRVSRSNSATLVNKGLEVIEAHLLFGIPFERIEVVVHPQSSSTRWSSSPTARPRPAGPPRMLLPIALGLGWPDRVPDARAGATGPPRRSWEFEPLDDEAFPRSRWPAGRGAAALRRRSTTRPTRSRSTRSTTAASASSTSSTPSPTWWGRMPPCRSHVTDLTLDDVLAADSWARAAAARTS